MDPLDAASDRAMGYQRLPADAVPGRRVATSSSQGILPASRRLSARELHELIDHLVNTEMMPLTAAKALGFGLDRLTLEDFEIIGEHLARCRHCNTWTRQSELVVTTCPACWGELDGAQNAPH